MRKMRPRWDTDGLCGVVDDAESWEESLDLGGSLGSNVAVGEHSFAHMEDDIDRQKLLGAPAALRLQPASEFDHLTLQVQVRTSFHFFLLWTVCFSLQIRRP